jgi:hypothetical protein
VRRFIREQLLPVDPETKEVELDHYRHSFAMLTLPSFSTNTFET